jgi:fatty acid-binding protein DegV
VSRAVAKLAGLFGIRMLGRAVDGRIKPVAKPRGEKRSLEALFAEMQALGYLGGKVRISHCENATLAGALSLLVREVYPEADITVQPMGGLCSFYAERGGLIVGFERGNEWL